MSRQTVLRVVIGQCDVYHTRVKNDDTSIKMVSQRNNMHNGTLSVLRVLFLCVHRLLSQNGSLNTLHKNLFELQELNTGYVESNLLNQVRIVWTGQILPVWIEKKICIFIKIGKKKSFYNIYFALWNITELVLLASNKSCWQCKHFM